MILLIEYISYITIELVLVLKKVQPRMVPYLYYFLFPPGFSYFRDSEIWLPKQILCLKTLRIDELKPDILFTKYSSAKQ